MRRSKGLIGGLLYGLSVFSMPVVACDANTLGDLVAVQIQQKSGVKDLTSLLNQYFREIEGNLRRENQISQQMQKNQDPHYWDAVIEESYVQLKDSGGDDCLTVENIGSLIKSFKELENKYSFETLDTGLSIIFDKLA